MRARYVAALAALAFVPASAAAQPKLPVIEEMTVRITVGADATLHVTESIDAPLNSPGVFAVRRIPLRTPDGRPVRVRYVTARDGLGASVRVEVRERGEVLDVYPGLLSAHDPGDVQLRLSYVVYRAMRSRGTVDELDWLVVPNKWKGHVRKLRVDVHFPSSLRTTREVQAILARPDGTPVRARLVRGNGTVTLDAPLASTPDESARLTLSWPSGHVNFATPEPSARWPWRFRFTAVWFVPAGMLGITALVWMTNRAIGARPVVPRYEPPPGLGPGEAGVVIDGRIHAEDIVAAVADLAARGYVALERAPGESDVIVTVKRPWVSDRNVRPWEAVLLANIFTDGFSSITLSSLRASRATASIREALSAELAERGFFTSAPLALRRVGRWAAAITTAVWVQLAWNQGADSATMLAGIATGVVLWVLAGVIASGVLTPQGRRARLALRGFREFLARVDTPRLERLPAGALDENLPWAVALGVTEAWLGPTPVR